MNFTLVHHQMRCIEQKGARFLPLISILFTSKEQAFPQAKEMEGSTLHTVYYLYFSYYPPFYKYRLSSGKDRTVY